MKVIERNISELIPAEYNPRYITDEALEHLKASIQRFDAVEPVLVNMHPDRKNIIISGHQRLKAAKALGMEKFPCVELNLDKDKERELNIRMNKNTGGWDWDELATYFDTEELTDWGFTEDELFGNFETEEPEAEEDDYEIPEEIHTDFVLGDLIEIGEHRLLCGDSTDSDQVAKLMDGEKADMVFTDPPYGVSYEGGHNKKKRKGIENDTLKDVDLSDLFRNSLNVACANTESHAPFYIWYASGKSLETYDGLSHTLLKVRAVICWYKVKSGLGAFMSQYIPNYEPCIYAHKVGESIQWFGDTDEKTVWELKNDQKNKLHPTQKPVELAERALKNSSKKTQIVYDCFLGGGTTMVACHQLGRKCYGMELDPKYCQVIVDRMLKLDPALEIKVNGSEYVKTGEKQV